MKLSVNFILIATLLVVGSLAADHWTYSHLDEWPINCQSGKKQSPIAISKRNAIRIDLKKLKFDNYDNDDIKTTLENNGHTGGGLSSTYVLDNIHFHWGSEHTIDGGRHPLEAHLVHYKQTCGNMVNASNYPDGLVVLAVMFDVACCTNKDLAIVTNSVKSVSKNLHSTLRIQDDFKPEVFLPDNTKCYYMYTGSLTTPGCNEVVTWLMFEDAISISQTQLNQLSQVYTDAGKLLSYNFRPLQELHGRKVFYTSASDCD
ncbi:hypothetical protein NQ315_015426 [Exocentrus adspersus]|uniref:Carbonic anhydrase n=1 Tax=Exocentrus adspersus TaxID=1586481 RepID=A0AAV8VLY3_9CUCU|nr:hypothetical protein NQ315_015426 [Exocentrus adspersus]